MQLPSQTTKAAVKAMKKTTNSQSKATTLRLVTVESKDGNLDSATTTNLTLTAAKIDWVEGVAGTSEEHVNKVTHAGTDVVKTRMQLSTEKLQGFVGTFKDIIKEEGAGRLYRGLVPPLLLEAPKRAVKLWDGDKESGKPHPDRNGPVEQGTTVNEKLQEETVVVERNGGLQVKIEIEQS
ncbi:hypothetical protein DFJ43DRAFT_1043056 [Lentinula guzmanii]|uniref:Mitochondrial carrier n=1 Tax=Lentinula guzmanii TaxID=2804957 RepID=A0AA38MVR8_9AGAR|nr:hypothetical protein DFJ43DRAFT_1043056 [Lentinula guzmanii]